MSQFKLFHPDLRFPWSVHKTVRHSIKESILFIHICLRLLRLHLQTSSETWECRCFQFSGYFWKASHSISLTIHRSALSPGDAGGQVFMRYMTSDLSMLWVTENTFVAVPFSSPPSSSHFSPALAWIFFMICSDSDCSSTSLPWLQFLLENLLLHVLLSMKVSASGLLQHGLEYGLQCGFLLCRGSSKSCREFTFSALGVPPPHPSFPTLVFTGFFSHTFFPPHSSNCWAAFLMFLKYVLPEVSPSQRFSHALPGVHRHWLKLAVSAIGQILASPHKITEILCVNLSLFHFIFSFTQTGILLLLLWDYWQETHTLWEENTKALLQKMQTST